MPRSRRKFLSHLSNGQNDAYRRVLDFLSLKRRNRKQSASQTARQTGTTLKTVRRYAASALEVRSGRLDVTASDRLPRPMRMLTPHGEMSVLTKGSRSASRIGKYNNALREYYISGNPNALKRFALKTIRSGGKTYEFVTDARTLNRLARVGAVHFLDIYALAAES